jgi:hypothetical protein
MEDHYNEEEVWSTRDSRDQVDTEGTGVLVNGSFFSVDAGSNFKEEISKVTENVGLGKFKVYLNGEKIKPSEAPTAFSEGMKVEIVPYDIAG